MPDIELRLIANNQQYIAGIKEAQAAEQSMNDSFKTGESAKKNLITGSTNAINNQAKGIGEADNTTKKAGQSIRAQLRSMAQEMAALEAAGKGNSKEFIDLAEKTGKLKLQFQTAQKVIKEFSNSSGGVVRGIVSMGEAMGGAFATAQGASALFSDSEEQASETTKKMTASIEVLVGIQSVMNVLNKDSEAIMFILNLQRKAAVLYTTLETAAQSKNIVVKYAATAAQWLLNAAMNANPIGLLITGILALSAAFLIFTNKALTAGKQLEVLNKLEEQFLDIDNARRENMKREAEERLSSAQDREKIAKAEGVSQLESLDLEIETAKIRRENASKYQSDLNSTAKTVQSLIEKIAKQREAYDELIFSPEANEKKNKELAEQMKVQIERNTKKLADMLAANKEFADADLELDVKKLEKQKLLKEQKFADDKALLESRLSKTKVESEAELKVKIDLLENEKAKELDNVNLSGVQRQAIMDKYARSEKDMRKEFSEKTNKEELQGVIELANASLSATMEGTQENHTAKLALIDAEYNAQKYNDEITIKNAKLLNKTILALNAKYLADKKAQNNAYQIQELDFNNSQLASEEEINKIKQEEIIAGFSSTISQTKAATKKIEDIQQGAIDREMALNNKKYAKGLINEETYQTKLSALKKDQETLNLDRIQKQAQKEKEAIDYVKDQTISNIKEIIAAYVTQQEAKVQSIEDQLSTAESELDTEKALQDKGLANNVDAKKTEIAQLKKEKQKALDDEKEAQKVQLALDSAEQLSSMITATANIWKGFTKVPIVGPILAVAATLAMWGSFAAAKVMAVQAINSKAEHGAYGDDTGIVIGKRHSQGGERFTDHLEVEQGERWGILNRTASNKYANLFPEMISSMNNLSFPGINIKGNHTTVNVDTKKMQSELESINSGIKILNDSMANNGDVFYSGHAKVIKLNKNHIRIIHASN